MSGNLDIRNVNFNSDEATFELYVGFGQWRKIEIEKKYSSIAYTDWEEILEEEDLYHAHYDMEELMEGFIKILSSTLNIYGGVTND